MHPRIPSTLPAASPKAESDFEASLASHPARQSDTRFFTIFDNSPILMSISSVQDNSFLDINQAFLDLLGYTREEVVQHSALDLGLWVDLADRSEFIRRLRTDQHLRNFETRLRSKTGEFKSVLMSGETIEMDGNRYLLIQALDIAEQKRTEMMMTAQRDLARLVTTAPGDRTTWEFCLQTALQVSGMDCGGFYLFDESERAFMLVTALGLSDGFVQSVRALPEHSASGQLALAGKIYHRDAADVRQNPVLHAEGLQALSIFPLAHLGQVVGCLNIGSKRLPRIPPAGALALETIAAEMGNLILFQQAHQELRDSEARFRTSSQMVQTILDASADLVFLASVDGQVLAINPAMAAILRRPVADLPGLNIYDLLSPTAAVRHRQRVQQMLAAESPIMYEDHGRQGWFEINLYPIRDDQQHICQMVVFAHPITERKTMEAALRAGEARAQALLTAIPDVMLRLDRTGLCLDYRAGLRATPVQVQPSLVGRPIHAIFGVEAALIESKIADTLASQTLQTFEAQLAIPGTGPCDYDVRMAPSGPDEVFVIARDITEQKATEAALRRVEHRNAALIERAPDGIVVVDAEGVFTFISASAYRIFGFAPPALLGTASRLNVHPDDLQRIAAVRRRLEEAPAQIQQIEYRFRHCDGSYRWLESTYTNMLAEPDLQGVVINFRDVTERKQADEALRAQEEFFRAVSLLSADYVFYSEVDEAGRLDLRWVGAGFEAVTGYSLEEYKARGGWAAALYPDDRESDARDLALLMANQKVVTEVRTIHKDGSLRWAHIHATPRWEAGPPPRLTGIYGALRDITEQKAAEAALRASEEKYRLLSHSLEERVQQRTVDLARAMRMKDEFLASMSHELRTPLTAILGLAEVLDEGVYGALTTRQANSVRLIHDSGTHLLNLINDILDLSKVEAGKLDLALETFAVDDICQSSLTFVRQTAVKKRQQLRYQTPAAVYLRADARRVKQILVNLLSNAVKFTPEGGELGLTVEALAEQRAVAFTVWDKGKGIAPEDFERLFKPFVQLDSSLSRNYEGTGLGLSLVQRLADLHGGGVQLESIPGAGSRFIVTIPGLQISEPGVPPVGGPARLPLVVPGAASLAPSEPGDRPHILLADDNEVNTELLADYLSAWGYVVKTVQDGAAAVAAVTAARPSLVLMDIQMPGMDGLQAIRAIRALADPNLARVPIIAVTALVMAGDRERCLAAGADEYLAKPLHLQDLAATIRAVFEAQADGLPAGIHNPDGAGG